MNIYRNIRDFMPLLLGVAIVSCSERDDYNTPPEYSLQGMERTVWENICNTPELSDFAAVVERLGFAGELQGSKVYTVWAPQNGTFDKETLVGETDEHLLNRFVKNHLAFYRHTLKDGEQQRIH